MNQAESVCMTVSKLAQNIIGSEIIKLAGEVNEKIKQGRRIYNFTIGDFDPTIFPIPEELTQYIIEEYQTGQTNYPPADGVPELRNAVSQLLEKRCGLSYPPSEILITAGARPVIYTIFRALVDAGDEVVFATPSWNNNHYTYLNFAKPVVPETKPENDFMPTADDIAPYIKTASLIALCSPQNPTGTVFTKKGLEDICDLVLEENKRRGGTAKPLYLMYDQIYWALTYGNTQHYNPVSLRPEMRPYTIFVDGISKSLAATGVRVGWCMGPKVIIDKMKAILTHIGAWAPKAEQIATARYLNQIDKFDAFLNVQKQKLHSRLDGLYKGLITLKGEGHRVDVIAPKGAIYLTVKFGLHGQRKPDGSLLENTRQITQYLLDEAALAVVPFYAFGSPDDSAWYRLSVGTCKVEEIPDVIGALRKALAALS